MNRRSFSQLLATSFVAPGLLPDFAPGNAHAAPPPSQQGKEGTLQPVNVEDFRRLAQAKLPQATFDYIDTGSMDQVTLRENVAAFQRLRILPPILSGVEKTDLSTTVLKQAVSMPILLAPVAAQRMYHPQGALAAARAAKSLGTIYGMSSSVGNSVEEVAAASDGPKWFQLYVPKDREVARKLIERAERSGFGAVVITVDLGEWKDADRRNKFTLPRDMLLKHLRDIGFENITEQMSDEALIAFNRSAWDLTFSWDFFDWLRSITKLPLLIKGVLRREDAEKAVSIGLDGIIVSNHGGRRIDGMPASIEMLPSVVAAVRGRAEIFLDSGIRRGTDVLKALALGARAVLIGRPYVWALAAAGEEGVRSVLELLRDELQNVMISSGCSRVQNVPRSLILTPEQH